MARFERYLPMLQLKKQQLQLEIQEISSQIAENDRAVRELRERIESWLGLWAGDEAEQLPSVRVEARLREGNIAGVPVPILDGFETARPDVDLYSTPAWYDDALEAAAAMARFRLERQVLEEKRRRISRELAYTTQRVNLFEKVKIPECRENIRVIKIFLGDQQTAAVVRGKLAKRRTAVYENAVRDAVEEAGTEQR